MEPNDQILVALGRLEGKVDALMTRQALHDEDIQRLDVRLRQLEQGRSWLLGAAAVAGAIASFVATKLGV
tara:strand:+ start:842 stop:1051 length:210 start_codon:yes stop_codon:yes gene_type:complete